MRTLEACKRELSMLLADAGGQAGPVADRLTIYARKVTTLTDALKRPAEP